MSRMPVVPPPMPPGVVDQRDYLDFYSLPQSQRDLFSNIIQAFGSERFDLFNEKLRLIGFEIRIIK